MIGLLQKYHCGSKIVLCILLLGVQKSAAECPNGWTRFNDSCYSFGHHDVTFLEATRFCSHYNAYLVIIESDAENKFIASVLEELNSNRHWIGLTDEIVEGTWKWYSTDKVANYTDWYPGQPDLGGRANCADILSSAPYAYHWLDDDCTSKFRPICERGLDTETSIVGK
ncbi:C-type lectin domain family 10 member A-like [Ruditapes philippinarum]|uniref:C-type lectin domain family 10 member A-like n=1 Tax=Ruditapes philippinarum TaxID=129788 RepID=UPI00295A975B|nr:C-type lectin domain family 10 member A-like [Ruditapes philippinarum]